MLDGSDMADRTASRRRYIKPTPSLVVTVLTLVSIFVISVFAALVTQAGSAFTVAGPRIVFESDRAHMGENLVDVNRIEIYVMDTNGREVHRLDEQSDGRL